MTFWPLTIDLQEGFTKDLVIVSINGQEVFTAHDVSTSLLTGPARSWTTTVEEGVIQVYVQIPTRDLHAATMLTIQQPLFLGLSIVPTASGDTIRFLQSSDRFGYL